MQLVEITLVEFPPDLFPLLGDFSSCCINLGYKSTGGDLSFIHHQCGCDDSPPVDKIRVWVVDGEGDVDGGRGSMGK